MPVTAVKKYETSDGKAHDDYTKAKAHEAKYHAEQRKLKTQQRVLAKLKTALFDPNLTQSGGNNLVLDLLNKPKQAEQLRNALNTVLEMHRNKAKKSS